VLWGSFVCVVGLLLQGCFGYISAMWGSFMLWGSFGYNVGLFCVYYVALTVGLFDVHCGNVRLFCAVGLFCLGYTALTVGLSDIHCGNVGLFYVVGLFCAAFFYECIVRLLM